MNANHEFFKSTVNITAQLDSVIELITLWLNSNRPTWGDLIHVLCKMKLDALAKKIESYLEGARVEEFDNTELLHSKREDQKKGRKAEVNGELLYRHLD